MTWEAQLLSRVEQLEARVEALEQVRGAADMAELIDRSCTCGVKSAAGKAHSPDCALSVALRDMALRAGS